MEIKFLRLVYAAEFLLALIAVYTCWSQVGGQAHLDMMAWYFKLFFGVAMAYAIVRATSAALNGAHAWNRGTLRWMAILAVLAAAAGLVTYYYHVYEPNEEEEEEPATQTRLWSPGGF